MEKQTLARKFLVALLALTLGWTTTFPVDACLLAHRLRVVAPHLTEQEVQLYAHGNMNPQKLAYKLLAATPCVNGQADIFACDGVDLLGHLNLSEIGGGAGNDLWGWTDPVTGAEIAIIGRTNGTSFIDVSDPENPIYLGNLPSHSGTSSWRDIKTFADHAFVVADGQPHGIQVFDLTQLRGVVNPPVTFSPTTHFGAIGNAHNIVINEATGFAYAVGSDSCSGGLYMVDINTPTNPTFAGCFSADGYTHDAQCVIYNGPDQQHVGREVCFASNEDTLTIVDVTDKSNPIQRSRTGYTQPGASHYAHQGWLTEDQRYFVFDDEFDEMGQGHNTRTYVWDVANIDAPTLVGFWDAAGSSVDHNQYIRGNFTYQANYARGLRILELTDLANAGFSEAGFFDSYPESDGNNFDGAWSTYPFFASGIVLLSDINRGLFILKPQMTTPNTTPSVAITAPSDGSFFPQGTVIGFSGTADDVEDGDLSASLAWTSSLDGPIGSGSSFSQTLSVGQHTLTASATDSGGRVGSDAIVVSIASASGCAADVNFDNNAGGWTNTGSSTCSTGTFVLGTPSEQTASGVVTQVGGDHTSGTGNAFFSAFNTTAGGDDVDGGTCIVESPVYVVSEASDVSAWTFHGQRDAGDDAGDFFAFEISTDGGATYTSLRSIGDATSQAVWTQTQTTVSAGTNVRFRLQVADGPSGGDLVEAGIDDVSICPSGISNAAPTVAISTPTDGSSFTAGDSVTFSGSADDTEDGDLSASLNWTSSLDGSLGSGASFTTTSLSVGTHTVSASVTDSGGLSDSEQISITVSSSPTGGCLHEVDFEAGSGGWVGGASTCSTGAFVVGSPDPTAWQVGGGNPGNAFFTAPNPGGIGSADVDGGTCEALSPSLDASGRALVEVSLDYFHGQRDAGDDANDGFSIEVLNNGSVVDTLVAIGDATTNPAWTSVSTVVANPGSLQLRVRASDGTAGGDIIEGGIDNVRVCPLVQGACIVAEDFESGAAGWGADTASTCSTGTFVLGNPTAQVSSGVTTQVGGANSGINAFFTAANTSAGNADVDGGNCILSSPTWAVGVPSTLLVSTFHGQRDAGDDAAGDFFLLEVSTDGGASWNPLVSAGDAVSNAVWTTASTSIPAGSNVRLRAQCSDGAGPGDIIECGIDDVSICPAL